MTNWLQGVRRTWLEIVTIALFVLLFVAGVLDIVNFKVALYKLGILAFGVFYSHVVRQIMFPHIRMTEMLERNDPAAAAAIIGTLLLQSAIVLSFSLAL